jgi:hypothetical protein
MARRALGIDDVVVAKGHPRGRQAHFADRMQPADAIAHGVLIPHARYVVVGRWWRTPKGRRGFVVQTEASKRGPVAKVMPGEVRLWTNRVERRWRRDNGAEA